MINIFLCVQMVSKIPSGVKWKVTTNHEYVSDSCVVFTWIYQRRNSSVLMMLCAFVFIFTSGSWALLGRPRCGLSIWLSLITMFNTFFLSLCQRFSRENGQNTKILKVRYFRMIQNGRRRLQGAQSINTEKGSQLRSKPVRRAMSDFSGSTWQLCWSWQICRSQVCC